MVLAPPHPRGTERWLSNTKELRGMRIRYHAYIPLQPKVSSMAMRKFLADKLLSLANAIEQDTSKEKLQAAVIVGRRKLADWIQPELPTAS